MTFHSDSPFQIMSAIALGFC